MSKDKWIEVYERLTVDCESPTCGPDCKLCNGTGEIRPTEEQVREAIAGEEDGILRKEL